MTASKLVLAAATLTYPVLVYVGLGRFSPVWLAIALAGLLAVRAWAARDVVWLLACAGALVLATASALGGGWVPLKLYPVVLSAVLLVVFGASLLRPPTIIERIARITEPQLPPAGIAYTRRVTIVWCGFFVLNGTIALVSVAWGSDEAWLLYNGLISYVLMGVLFAAEWLVRHRVRPRAGWHGGVNG